MRIHLLMRRTSAFVPPLMSCAALATIALHVVRFGAGREPDEGTAAHVWQLLIALQLPVIALFAIRWLPDSPRQASVILAFQLGFLLAALLPVYLLGL